MAIRVTGFDTAKHVFQVHGADASGKTVLRKRPRRNQGRRVFFERLRLALWGSKQHKERTIGREFVAASVHEVRLVAPRFVKAYLKGQKNDMQDAAAICEAVRGSLRRNPSSSRICKRCTAFACHHCFV